MQETETGLDQAVAGLAAALGETAPLVLAQLRRIVQVKGVQFAGEMLDQARATETGGGMLIQNGSRRRTLGGIFFSHTRQRVTPAEQAQIWPNDTQPRWRTRSTRSQGQASPQVAAPAIAWEERAQVYRTLSEQEGKVNTVKITLVGRPGKIVAMDGYVLTLMQGPAVPALPKGMPQPPPAPRYAVCIQHKQWNKVSAALAADPEDSLIVEGYASVDAQLPGGPGIVVYALRAVSKKQQIAQRQEAQPPS